MTPPAAKTSVLFIDDETQMRRLLRASLEGNGYEFLEAANGADGMMAAVRFQPSIIILDLGLPDMDGMEVLKRLREWSQVPIVVLSARDRDSDKVAALDAGANDYMTKPFSTNELLARLRVIQRYHAPVEKDPVFKTGPLEVDLVTRTVKVRGQAVKLTRTQYSLLRYFVQHAGRVLTHKQLLREVWEIEDEGKTALLRVYVGALREKIEANPSRPELILTVAGVGYRLNGGD